MKHVSAKSNHYDFSADKYDAIYDKHPEIDNKLIEKILRFYKVKTVFDLSCGTGSQAIHLAKNGFEVVGSDINAKMLAFASEKTKKYKLNCELFVGDMRTTKAGQFDAVLTIFNAIGHLTKSDYTKALKNINHNLKQGGVYIFDIFNLNYMLSGDNITKLTIDEMAEEKSRILRKVQYSTIDVKGVLASHTVSMVKNKKTNKVSTNQGSQTLQIYNTKMLEELFAKTGFKLLKKYSIDGGRFHHKQTKHMLLVAKKIS